MTKLQVLEHLAKENRPLTSKEIAVDADLGQATVAEVLERCAAQGLVTRDKSRRPREYELTTKGRERLEILRAAAAQRRKGNPDDGPRGGVQSEDSETSNPGNPNSNAERVQQLEERLGTLEQRVQGIEEDFEEILPVAPHAAPLSEKQEEPTAPGRAERLLERLRRLAAKESGNDRVKEIDAELAKLKQETPWWSRSTARERVQELERERATLVVGRPETEEAEVGRE